MSQSVFLKARSPGDNLQTGSASPIVLWIAAARIPKMPKHILVVDDDAEVRTVVGDMLEELGYRMSMVAHGAEMRGFLSTNEAVDLVILDGLLPGEPSRDLALFAKSLSIPVLMISGDPGTMENAEAHGLQLLRKPFTNEQLRTAVALAFSSGQFGQRDE
jgi:DNA-binding NtrC family response regulator